ncbi:hypothetical protein Lal_00011372 [Lupinus albus]|nr:hypothetical protein Lal_00011372 [Lupinus albus]
MTMVFIPNKMIRDTTLIKLTKRRLHNKGSIPGSDTYWEGQSCTPKGISSLPKGLMKLNDLLTRSTGSSRDIVKGFFPKDVIRYFW